MMEADAPMPDAPPAATAPLGLTEVALRDAQQSLLATRLRLDDMLAVAEQLDRVGYWSLESWGGATFDACIRFLGEDPWERIREFKAAMPNTPQQMLLRGQNLLGYRHYADDVVRRFVERAAANGVDVFRVFDAMNDPRNLETAIGAVREHGRHAQGTLSYTTSPVHDMDSWVALGRRIAEMGADSLAIKDMAGLLTPYDAYELVSRLKATLSIPVHMQCHATAGLSTATILKAVEAGIDNVDTAISSLSMTSGHSPTESVVAILKGQPRDTGIDLEALAPIAEHFREVRRRYARFEGSLRGVDARVLISQVPGGMLTNMENQLREQNASERLGEILAEMPAVRRDLGYIPLVTPTSQIVGAQAALNVLTGERYGTLSKETVAVLRGEYGATPAPVNAELRARALDGDEPVVCRPADKLADEMERLSDELKALSVEHGFALADESIDDVLSYALFPQVGLKFLRHRGDPDAFEPPPGAEPPTEQEAASALPAAGAPARYTVTVSGQRYVVQVAEGADAEPVASASRPEDQASDRSADESVAGEPLRAPMAGAIVRVAVSVGQPVRAGDVLLVLEAMKMETEVRAVDAGTVRAVHVSQGDQVDSGAALVTVS